MKYPNILFFRYDKYNEIDTVLEENKEKLLCNINIINNKEEINKLFDCNYHLLVTYGNNELEYITDVNKIITDVMRKRWVHYNEINIDLFNNGINYCYIYNIINVNHEIYRPIFSIYTTCFKSYEKIFRAYNSLQKQILKSWEWVIVDDSPENEHFEFLKILFKSDKRIRLYKRSENSGSIGNVKNEAVSLCRGKYVLELDHDDEILPDLLFDATKIFDEQKDVGFIYSDFINIYENGDNFHYSNFFGLGYAGYYKQKYNGSWVYVCITPNINNITLGHIVSVPNHPRIWRKKTLMEIGNYNEMLPVSDDYELFLRTAISTKIVKIPKLGYIQYMNNNNNNFSLIRNSEINRLVFHLKNHFYIKYDVTDYMNKIGASEDISFLKNHSQIWKRIDYEHKYCNTIINLNYSKIYCIIGIETLQCHLKQIKQLYLDKTNDFILLDNKFSSEHDYLTKELDYLNLSNIKCYSMDDCSDIELINYFKLMYKTTDEFYIFERKK
jgi:glycosyltransferase involved in cell wall biosynthesis